MTEHEAIVWLNSIPGLGNSRIREMLEHFGSASEIARLNFTLLDRQGFFPAKIAEALRDPGLKTRAQEECRRAGQNQIRIVAFGEADYPENLRHIPDAPVVIYLAGQLFAQDRAAVAIVGSRHCSLSGLRFAEKLAGQLAECGITVVSGLARGIDTAAHQGALKAGGRTLAVLGSGLLNVYPPENKKLYDEILSAGAVISEFLLSAPPRAQHFPQRNRIISGVSLGVVVVEASQRSGALITSRFALEQGREVFAVPGPVESRNAEGVNQLLKDGARLVSCVEDILEEIQHPLKMTLPGSVSNRKNVTEVIPKTLPALTPDENKVLSLLVNSRPVSMEELIILSQMPLERLASVVLQLELKKYIQQIPGRRFVHAVSGKIV